MPAPRPRDPRQDPAPRATDALGHVVRAIGDVLAQVGGRPGGSPSVDPAAAIRLSDAERDAAAEVLRDAYAEGRLEYVEFTERLTVVHAARVHADLLPVLEDLPGPHRPPSARPAADEVVAAVFREVRRTGVWELPPRLRVQARAGTVLLDLRGARVRSAVVEIDVRVTAGRVVIIVSDGIRVELHDGLTLLGNRRAHASRRRPAARPVRADPQPDTPVTLVVGGEIVGGQLIVRAPTARERWRGV